MRQGQGGRSESGRTTRSWRGRGRGIRTSGACARAEEGDRSQGVALAEGASSPCTGTKEGRSELGMVAGLHGAGGGSGVVQNRGRQQVARSRGMGEGSSG